MKINEYMMTTQAADYLGIKSYTLRRWENAGKITSLRNPMNKYRLYKKEDLDKLLSDIESARSIGKGSK